MVRVSSYKEAQILLNKYIQKNAKSLLFMEGEIMVKRI